MSHHRGTLNEFGGVLEEVGAEIGHLVDVVVNAITHHGGGVPWVQRALALIPDAIKHSQHGPALAAAITELATAVSKAEAHRSKNQVFTDADVKAVSAAAAKLAALVPSIDLSVGALDTPDERVETLLFDSANLLARVGAGRPLHEGFYDPVSNVWHNWSLELAVYPNEYRAPEPPTLPAAATAAGGSEPATARTPSGHLKSDVYAPVVAAVESSFAVRTVGAGHSFNGGPSLGGSREQRAGTLVSLDHYNRVTPLEASVVEQRFAWLGAERAARVCHIEAGARLRDVTRRLWDLGLAFACQGSTDAQSIGGLISSDLHGTGNQHAFLSEALIELTLVTGAGRIVTLTRQSDAGHWRTDEASPRELRWLPAAGAIGMLGIVVDCLAVLVPRYNLEVQFTYMARREVEAQLAALVASNDHVSFYYPGGVPLSRIETVRMHRWSVTDKHPTWLAPTLHLISELSDHVVAAFAPNIFFDAVGEHGIATDPLTKALNDLQQPLVLPAPVAYPRKLYYRHDEDEWAVPFDRFLPALHAVLDMLAEAELKTIVELRFAPNNSQALLGAGTAGRMRDINVGFIELATALGPTSTLERAVVYRRFDHILKGFGGRPHLGKECSMHESEMAAIYGADWDEFQSLREQWDPTSRFLPPHNIFLHQVFVPDAAAATAAAATSTGDGAAASASDVVSVDP